MLNRAKEISKLYSIFMIFYLIVYLAIILINPFYIIYVVLSTVATISLFFLIIFKFRNSKTLLEYSYDIFVLMLVLLLFTFIIKTSEEQFQIIFMATFLTLTLISFCLSKLFKNLLIHTQILIDTTWLTLFTLFIFEVINLIANKNDSIYSYITMASVTTFAITAFSITSVFEIHYNDHYKICPIINRDLNAQLNLKLKNEV